MKIADIIDHYISGDWGNDDYSDETPKEVFCVRGADIVPITNTDFKNIPLRYIALRSFSDKLLSEGDIVIEKSGGSPTQSTGRVVYISKDLVDSKKNIVCSNFCTAFRVKNEWNPKFVYYYFLLVYDSGIFFNFEGKTSGLKNLQMETAFKSIDIPAVDRKIQDKIVDELSLLDKKIALNREENATLEAMAKQMYDYWFVQFDFPDANGNPYKSSGGKMVWNEKLKREIPEGWEVKALSEICDIVNGATPSTANKNNYGGDIIWITPKDLSDQKNKFIFKGERNITQTGYDSCSTTLVPRGSILMSSRAPIGLLSIASNNLCTNQGFKTFVPLEMDNNLFVYYYVKRHMKQIEQLGSGTTFKEVSRDDLKNFPILYVSNRVVYSIWHEKVLKIFRRQELLQEEITELTNLRDFLLPLLMNGQVSIKE